MHSASTVSGNGTMAANGVAVCTANPRSESPGLLADGEGGAYVAWMARRGGTGAEDIYASA